MVKYGFGVDVGGTNIKLGFFDVNGKLLDKWMLPTNKEEQGKHILSDIARAIDNKLEQEGIAKSEIIGIGIGVPGPVRSDGIVNGCVNLGWGISNIEEELSALTGMPVVIGNDANVAALGEMWQGGAKGCSDVVMVTLGTGVGGGIIIGGKCVAGFCGAGGEIGHITVNHDELEACNCGKYGCLEQYASATGIVRMTKRKLRKTTQSTSLNKYSDLTAKHIFDEARNGDAIAEELVDQIGEILGMALANMACVVNPEVIVIGGGVSKAGDILKNTIQKYFIENAFYACKDTKFTIATLGNDAGIYGCMKMILDKNQ